MNEEKLNSQEQIEEGFTLVEFFMSLRNNIILLVVVIMGALGIGVVYTWSIVTPMYTAQIGVSVQPDTINSISVPTDLQLINIYNQVLNDLKFHSTTNDVLETVLANPEISGTYSSVSQIRRNVSTASAGGNALSFYISYKDPNPAMAQKMVIEIFNSLKDKVNDGEIYIISRPQITSFDLPKIPQVPSSPNKILNVLISIMLGGIIGVVIVILKEQFSNKFSSKEEIERQLAIPVFAAIPTRVGEKGVKK